MYLSSFNKLGMFLRKTQNLKKSSSWFWRLLSKCQNHEEDFFQILCASQKVRTLPIWISFEESINNWGPKNMYLCMKKGQKKSGIFFRIFKIKSITIVRSILVNYFIHLRLKIDWSFDVKNKNSQKNLLNSFSSKSFFLYKINV